MSSIIATFASFLSDRRIQFIIFMGITTLKGKKVPASALDMYHDVKLLSKSAKAFKTSADMSSV
jgi:hypothetical protein